MTSNDQPGTASPAPDEVPAGRPASLDALDVLVGDVGYPAAVPG